MMELRNLRKAPDDPIIDINIENGNDGIAFMRSTIHDKTAELNVKIVERISTKQGLRFKCEFTPVGKSGAGKVAAVIATEFLYRQIGKDEVVTQMEMKLEK